MDHFSRILAQFVYCECDTDGSTLCSVRTLSMLRIKLINYDWPIVMAVAASLVSPVGQIGI